LAVGPRNMHETYRQIVHARAKAAIDQARALDGLLHCGTKGQIRELTIRELFRPLLPADIGVGTGHIIDASGKTSSQHDVILFDRRVLPPVVTEGEVGLFPIESVLYTIEIKSTLSAAELQSADTAAAQLLSFKYQHGIFLGDAPVQHTVEKVISTVFAFASDLKPGGISEVDRYKSKAVSAPPALRALCVVGRGYWFYSGTDWVCPSGRSDLFEVVGFMAGIMNRYGSVSASRGRPRIGDYLFKD